MVTLLPITEKACTSRRLI